MARRGLIALAAAALLAMPAAAQAEPAPFGHSCEPKADVRICPTRELTDRIASWDGTPLDVDVTLPATGDGPFPVLVMEHGYPGTKATFQAATADGNGGSGYHYNDVFFAERGYAVVTLSARGFGRSCGVPASRTAGCERGWTHIADHRFENRDTQHLIGLLVDQGIARADKIGVTGVSGGGGRTIGLAFLRNRIRTPDGSFAPWTSPGGTPLSIAAAYARWGWADLTSALVPNGRLLEDTIPSGPLSRTPIGVPKANWIQLLYNGGNAAGFVAPPGADAQADLTGWRDRTVAGEPFSDDVRSIVDTLSGYIGGAAGLSGSQAAPLLLQEGWNDDLFPVDEALRIYARLRAADRNAQVRLLLGDVGHFRAGNPVAPDRAFNEQAAVFFAGFLGGTGPIPTLSPPGSVTATLTACPKGTAGATIAGRSWDALKRGRVILRSVGAQRFTSAGGDAAVAQAIGTTSDPCLVQPARRERNVATYEAVSRGFTLLGSPTVVARIRAGGGLGQIAARLWDVGPGGRRLVGRSVYRLAARQSGTIRFQLHPNGWRFARGHRVRLELLGRDAPYAQASKATFSVSVNRLRLELPTRERPSRRLGIVR